jgi:hypothetical protein
MPVHCGLESLPLRVSVVALQSRMVLAARLRYTWLEWEPEEKVADRNHRVVSALLVYLFITFFSRSFGESLEIFFFSSPSSPSLCRGFLPFFRPVCVLCGFVDGSRNLFWSRYLRNIVFWSFLWSRGSLVSKFFSPLSFSDFFLYLQSGDFKLFQRMQQQQAFFCELLLSPWNQI